MGRRRKKKNRVPPEIREAVYERAQGMCEIMSPKAGCTGRAEHLHHRKLRSQGGEHTVENLVHICERCHSYAHLHRAEADTDGWIVRSSYDPRHVPFLRRGGMVFLFEDGEMEGYFEPEGADMGDGTGTRR